MNKINYIYEEMKDITNKTPILLIGGAAFIFRRIYKGNIYRIENTEDVREIISNFYGIDYSKPIVIDDISVLYRDSLLLKFIEETNIQIILLASEDNLSKALLSRIKTIIKLPLDECKSDFMSVLDAQVYIDDNELSQKELDSFIADKCPELARINRKIERRKNKDKLIQLLGNLE